MQRMIFGAFALLVFGAALEPARGGSWCSAEMSGSGDGATNCGFSSWDQCMQTARGSGGFCSRNVASDPPAVATPRRASKQARRQRQRL